MFRFLENNKNMFLPIKNKFKKKTKQGGICVLSYFVTLRLIKGILVPFFKLEKYFFI
jgi:hypothetical protein